MNDHRRDQRSDDGYAATRPPTLGLSVLCALAILMLSLLLASQNALGSTELLTNGGFEQGTFGWQRYPLDITFITVTQPVSSGRWAACLDRNIASSEIYIYQDVDVVSNRTYTLTGWAYSNEARFAEVCLRIDWRYSASPDVEHCLQGDYDGYRPITIGLAMAPTDAVTARIVGLAKTGTAGPLNPVYFDELSFTSGVSPTTPISVYVPLVLKGYSRGSPPSALEPTPTSDREDFLDLRNPAGVRPNLAAHRLGLSQRAWRH